MRLKITGALAVVTTLALLSACSSDDKSGSGSTLSTSASEITLPSGVSIPTDVSFPSDATIPTAMIDQMLTQFEAAGMKVDRDCFVNLLQDQEIRKLVLSAGTPSAEVIQRMVACFQQ